MADHDDNLTETDTTLLSTLPFPPITTKHIFNCSYNSWYPIFRPHTPKARIIPLSDSFISYLRADGIILPPDSPSQTTTNTTTTTNDNDSGYSDSDSSSTTSTASTTSSTGDPSLQWPSIHAQIRSTISLLGGRVTPKLNWSAPKDATWISPTNDTECRTPNDIYLLLKSSDFITHDLEHAFEGCVDIEEGDPAPKIDYCLVLRKYFTLNPALEFRCFVRERKLIAVSQREMNYFAFLHEMRFKLLSVIQGFFDDVMLTAKGKDGKGFEDENFVFDVYIPPPHDRCWLVDVNPWAPRTDPLLFSWLEILTMSVGKDGDGDDEDGDGDSGSDAEQDETSNGEQVFRLKFTPTTSPDQTNGTLTTSPPLDTTSDHKPSMNKPTTGDDPLPQQPNPPSSSLQALFTPELRLVAHDDPEAYQFGSTKYSAHKLPTDVVQAGMTPAGMAGMMEEWRRVMRGKEGEESSDSSDDGGEEDDNDNEDGEGGGIEVGDVDTR